MKRNILLNSLSNGKASRGLLLGLGLTLTSMVQADAWISAPSGLTVGDEMRFSGGGLSAGTMVLVSITNPSGASDTQIIDTDDKGEFTLAVETPLGGDYFAEIWDLNQEDSEPLATYTNPVAE